MRTMIGFCLSLAVLLVSAEGYSFSLPKWGRCPDLSVKQAFQLQDYMNTWFIQGGYNLAMTQGEGRCGSATYTLDSAHNIVKVFNKQISASTDKWQSISGTAVPVDPSKDEGKFTVNLYVWGFWKVTAPYWVLDTDYTSYSVVYGCENFLLFFHFYSSWLLSRTQDLEDSGLAYTFYTNVNSTLKAHNIDPSIFNKVNQTDCSI